MSMQPIFFQTFLSLYTGSNSYLNELESLEILIYSHIHGINSHVVKEERGRGLIYPILFRGKEWGIQRSAQKGAYLRRRNVNFENRGISKFLFVSVISVIFYWFSELLHSWPSYVKINFWIFESIVCCIWQFLHVLWVSWVVIKEWESPHAQISSLEMPQNFTKVKISCHLRWSLYEEYTNKELITYDVQ